MDDIYVKFAGQPIDLAQGGGVAQANQPGHGGAVNTKRADFFKILQALVVHRAAACGVADNANFGAARHQPLGQVADMAK